MSAKRMDRQGPAMSASLPLFMKNIVLLKNLRNIYNLSIFLASIFLKSYVSKEIWQGNYFISSLLNEIDFSSSQCLNP